MTEQPPSAEAQALAETIYTWQGYAFTDGRVAEAIDSLIAQRVSAETERCAKIAGAERPAPAAVVDYTERARGIISEWLNLDFESWVDTELVELRELIAAALSAVAAERDAAAMRAFGQRVWSDTEEVAYQAGVSDTRERLQEPDVREAVEAAINEQRALEAGGCFNPSDETEGECADRDCYCTKQVAREADAAITKITEMLR